VLVVPVLMLHYSVRLLLFIYFAVYSFTDSCMDGYEGNPLVHGDYCRTVDGSHPSEGFTKFACLLCSR